MKERNNKKGLISSRRFILLLILLEREKHFLLFIGLAFLAVGLFYQVSHVAMWIGFVLAAYSAVANDSIQTIGTFIASNSDKKWWILWLFIGLIFLGTVSYSWIVFEGDVSFQRLASKGFNDAPQNFNFLQISAPLFLLILTRLKMPVSTTFLLLSSFTTSSRGLFSVLQKSISGYVIAFVVAFIIWILLHDFLKSKFKGQVSPIWTVAQWAISGFLWSLWIVQDAANIAVFLPRTLSLMQFIAFSGTIFIGIGLIFFLKGDRIQEIVEEKSEVKDVRPATIIDFVYLCILIMFTWINTVPMSTTWVFIGLLGGRELAIKIKKNQKLSKTWKLIRKDLVHALVGLIVSILIAIAANDELSDMLLSYF